MKELLQGTGTKKLHESPGKDSNSLWTYNSKTKEGGNLLGKCLEAIRSELKSDMEGETESDLEIEQKEDQYLRNIQVDA